MRRLLLGSLIFAAASVAAAEDAQQLTQTVGINSPAAFQVHLESAGAWQTRNEFRLPSSTGTTINLSDYKNGPFFAPRFSGEWSIKANHALKLLIAPLAYSVSFTPAQAVSISGTTFSANTPLTTTYKFNSYRLSYRYLFDSSGPWKFRLGLTAKIRDANISTSDGTVTAADPNLGFVPLIHLGVRHEFDETWFADLDIDALAAPQGRAEDLAIRLGYQVDTSGPWEFSVGYRMLEGGANNTKVFAFAFLHYAFIDVGYAF